MRNPAIVFGLLSIALLGTPAHSVAATAPAYCAQLRSAAAEKPECSFKTMGECRASLKGKGGGHCYKLHR